MRKTKKFSISVARRRSRAGFEAGPFCKIDRVFTIVQSRQSIVCMLYNLSLLIIMFWIGKTS
jgi:hypothetical protein